MRTCTLWTCTTQASILWTRRPKRCAAGLYRVCCRSRRISFQSTPPSLGLLLNHLPSPPASALLQAIDVGVELRSGAGDEEYLAAVRGALAQAFKRFPRPDLVIYNAGTDILAGDPLGRLGVSAAAVEERDALVWAAAAAAGAPIVMLLSGGYTRQGTPCIARSLGNLLDKFVGLKGGGAAGG